MAGKPQGSTARTITWQVRLTPTASQAATQRAKQLGLTRSNYLRTLMRDDVIGSVQPNKETPVTECRRHHKDPKAGVCLSCGRWP